MVAHPYLLHNQLLPEAHCPDGFVGNYTLGCKSGVMSVTQGQCHKHCAEGTARTGNVYVKHGLILHGSFSQPNCPSGGRIVLSCQDGQTRVVEGSCNADCTEGAANDEKGTAFTHSTLKHGDSG